MKKILIPIDTSQHSLEAIDYAIKFFKREDCEFFFLNTYSYGVNGLDALSLLQADDDWFDEPKLKSEKILGRLIKKYSSINKSKKHQFNEISECSDLIDGIKKTVKTLDIDIVLFLGKSKEDNSLKKYSKNTERIIESIRECPVMVIPHTANISKNQEFILASSFEKAISIKELESWSKLLRLVKGKGRLVVFNQASDLTSTQKSNLAHTINRIYNLNDIVVPVQYLNTKKDIKQFAQSHPDCILSIVDRKPNIWRRLGFENSEIVNLGPLQCTPLIALHA